VTDTDKIACALWYIAPGHAEIREERLTPLGPGNVRVRALFGALSRGTEALVAAGQVPETQFERMRAPFMGGSFPFPVKYGYATVGWVEDGSVAMNGQTVFALHPHQTAFDVPETMAVPLPANVPPARGVLAANMETALNATWDMAPGPSGRIAVVGAGVVGALTGYLCARTGGTDVTLVDIDPSRAEMAGALGVKFAAPEAAPRDCDAVVHASGSAAGLKTALDLAGDEATVLEMSWHGAGDVPMPLGGAFHSRRLKLISSQVGKVAPSRRANVTHRQRLEAAIALLADPRLDVLLAPAIAFADLPARLPDILGRKSGVLCQLIRY